MKCLLRIWPASLVAVALLSGCLSAPVSRVATEPVGPIGGANRMNLSTGPGELIVFTQTEDINDGGISYTRHTAYSIENQEGNTVRQVVNRAGNTDQSPTTVSISAGSYVVRARADGFGLVAVPILIAPNQLTAVYLSREPRPKGLAIPPGQEVTLPDGRLVGRKTVPATKK